jgi:hypothetical protein
VAIGPAPRCRIISCDVTSMISGVVRQMLHQVHRSDQCCAKRKHLPQGFVVTRFKNSACSLSTSAHFNCSAATLGNASGLNRTSPRFLKSAKKAELWAGSFQYANQIHSPLIMCTSVSRTERKLTPKVARELLSAEIGCHLQNPVVRPAIVFLEQLNVK